jgi:hypothetical protein
MTHPQAVIARGKDKPALPVMPESDKVPGDAKNDRDRPFAHPYYWAAFVLIPPLRGFTGTMNLSDTPGGPACLSRESG